MSNESEIRGTVIAINPAVQILNTRWSVLTLQNPDAVTAQRVIVSEGQITAGHIGINDRVRGTRRPFMSDVLRRHADVQLNTVVKDSDEPDHLKRPGGGKRNKFWFFSAEMR